ncbi:MAG: agmatinase [Chlorobi bacterium]|nr:agmatinase [Chlorobiota bacterium]
MRTVLPPSWNFLQLEDQYSNYETARIVILPMPYEATVSYGTGTSEGPDAILAASHYVEFFDDEYEREICFDLGIATLPPLDFSGRVGKPAVDMVYNVVRDLLADGKFVVGLGGEHTIAEGMARAHLGHHSGMSVLQLDAHSDLREEYEGDTYSHACVMARIMDFLQGERIVQLGVRAQCKEEFHRIRRNGVKTFYARDIRRGHHGSSWQDEVLRCLNESVYITFDVDYFDPSVMPSTGTPEPGGFFWDETLDLIEKIGKEKTIVGFDVVELAPRKDFPAPDYLAAKLTYKIITAAFT